MPRLRYHGQKRALGSLGDGVGLEGGGLVGRLSLNAEDRDALERRLRSWKRRGACMLLTGCYMFSTGANTIRLDVVHVLSYLGNFTLSNFSSRVE